MTEILSLEFMRLAAVAGVASALALSVLGVYVVLKRVVFVGLTLANVATLGAAAALALRLPVELTAIVASLGAAAALAASTASRRLPPESLIGWGFASASALTILILSRTPGDTDAMRLLFGNVLAISRSEAVMAVSVAAVVLTLHLVFVKRFVLVVFDPDTARAAGIATGAWVLLLYLTIGAATAAAVHETGALLAFAFLTLPAMAALLATRALRAAFLLAPAIAVTCVLGGLLLSFVWDLPTGPFTVALLAAAVPAAALLDRLRRWRAPAQP